MSVQDIDRSQREGNPFLAAFPALDQAMALAKEYLASLPSRPVARPVTAQELATALEEPLPEEGDDPARVVAEWFARAEAGIVASPGPRFFGFVNGGATPAALAGDWLDSALDQNAGVWLGSPAAAQTEDVVLRWLKELFGLPAAWAGGLTSGATMANLMGLAAARQWAGQRLGFDPARDGLGGQPPIPVLSSEAIHASAVKALGILGLGRNQVRRVRAVDGAVDLGAMAAELSRIESPAIVIGNAGEVNSGAFDDLDGLAALCREHPGGAWLHVDGAFGLFAAVSPRYAGLLRGIESADSVAADAHKWLNVPYDCGFAFVRDGEMLRQACAATGAYLAPPVGAGWDPHTHVPEMSRRFRALSVWCALKAHGREGYRAIVERCCANAAAFASWVAAQAGLELLAPARLNIVCFRFAPAGLSVEQTDALNRAAVTAIRADGRAFVSGTIWQGRAALRAAFDNWATTEQDVTILQEAVIGVWDRESNARR